MRTSRKNGFDSKYLTNDRIKALDEIGMIWKNTDAVGVLNLSDSNVIQNDELRGCVV